MDGMEMHIKKSKGFGKLRGGKPAKKKEVRVKMGSMDPKMMKAMSDMICAATK